MKIFVNGEPMLVSDSFSVQDLLSEMGIAEKRLAVEVNEEIVSRSRHETFSFSAGDKVEIVQAIGGG